LKACELLAAILGMAKKGFCNAVTKFHLNV